MTQPLESAPIVYRIDDRDEIVYVNENWTSFAQANGAPELQMDQLLGHSIWKFISEPTTAHLYQCLVRKVRASQDAVYLPLRCDSPMYRRLLRMEIKGVGKGNVEFRSELLEEKPHRASPVRIVDVDVPERPLKVCSWCHRIEMIGGSWKEMDNAIDALRLFSRPKLPSVTHGICPWCYLNIHEIVG